MTIQSLQKILNLENELHAAEESEREKAARWLKEQEAEIQRLHEEDLKDLEEKKEQAGKRAEEEAKQRAAALVRHARKRASYLDGIEDDKLLTHLKQIPKLLSGQNQ